METLHLAALPLRQDHRADPSQEDSTSARGAIIAVLGAGVIIGFVAGVVFMKWLG